MCNCGGASTNTSGTSTSMSSFSASSGGGYVVYRPDGSQKTVSSESEARMAVAASGGTYRKA